MRNLASEEDMQKTSTMNAQKSLQMVLTTLLLVLAILALDWQERLIQEKDALASSVPDAKADVTLESKPLHADCCLKHALQATEAEPGAMKSGFNQRTLFLLPTDSAKHIAVVHF